MKRELLAIVGYVVGLIVTPVVADQARDSVVFLMVDSLFGFALLLTLVRLPFRFLAVRRAKAAGATPPS